MADVSCPPRPGIAEPELEDAGVDVVDVVHEEVGAVGAVGADLPGLEVGVPDTAGLLARPGGASARAGYQSALGHPPMRDWSTSKTA